MTSTTYLRRTITKQGARIRRVEAALTECAAPFICGNQDGIDFEAIASEFNRRQRVASKALGLPVLGSSDE